MNKYLKIFLGIVIVGFTYVIMPIEYFLLFIAPILVTAGAAVVGSKLGNKLFPDSAAASVALRALTNFLTIFISLGIFFTIFFYFVSIPAV